ncbi:hypothetical protein [Mucilaginibacter sp. SG564]|uniref:hypothetical protein n=1 Tax=Mucilaginibacter sp. SG564 TaxID=2587022 RepID=UPI0015554A03|nr:hypothetical protein [Mucilaginibacter sp. SG564]NOW95816.1 hypothetical protein [Mucilaginibacter sp. SG564]
MSYPDENEAPDPQPTIPQFPTDRIELTTPPPEIPQFPTDRIEKGESSDQVKE